LSEAAKLDEADAPLVVERVGPDLVPDLGERGLAGGQGDSLRMRTTAPEGLGRPSE
jgi:hypothetical protein